MVGRYLWFCSAACRTTFASVPGRTWRPRPNAPPGARLAVECRSCRTEASLDLEPETAETFAVWLAEHTYDPSTGRGGCTLAVHLA